MDLRQLETLVAVGDHGGFSAAAEHLLTVQSNISTRISRLERELGVELVARTSRSLTPAGEVVAARARSILAAVNDIPSDLAAMQDRIVGSVTLGVIGSTARWIIPALLIHMQDHLPEVELRITEAVSATIADQVERDVLDVGLVNLPTESAGLTMTPLFEEDIFLVLPPGHRLTSMIGTGREITVKDLDGVELMTPPAGSSYRNGLEDTFSAAGVEMKVANAFDGIRLIESLAAAGVAPAFLPATATPPNHVPPPVAVPGIRPRVVGAITRAQRQPSTASQAVHAALTEIAAAEAVRLHGLRIPSADTLSRFAPASLGLR